ncbi:hypothetical protein AWZ03_001819 [Drosophila navojoa]|uniref:Uncharacterized protein n=1 Tax=Drosophila navojoa TaxID=7232 RepID=A0A484BSI0_DRONA|nr:hypothetical protein AWZ03_001819 [Drosophila navojoa]
MQMLHLTSRQCRLHLRHLQQQPPPSPPPSPQQQQPHAFAYSINAVGCISRNVRPSVRPSIRPVLRPFAEAMSMSRGSSP